MLVERSDELARLEAYLPASFMTRIFGIFAMLEVHSATEASLDGIHDLLKVFPTSLHLKSQQAMVSYHLREFDDAEALFDEIFESDPYRLEDIDTYSNILYVMEKRPKLSQMAHKYTQLDKYRPETCCLVGNYYSARGDHEKAIVYFKRALKLDRGYLSAWTLMGHEYVELKNSHAAVEAYRRAVDVNAKDYRAWYGLGQTYDILDMPLYSLGYFQKAVGLRSVALLLGRIC
jgi:anaphase-promoting complex subunit 8